ncbi:MAG: DNA-processing protein DprA [Arcobacter sp.]|jgi:DNA processing protein|uniref:DNA-processing protein DprA n=1 Tax=Arcobacter sp. TaxID=1872629 RepID=UPI00258F2D23|nr:DNA-processing protein DprA [Arcobacter sp.]MDD3007644.1 DNA-protecting protein DprA [Arcobacter sp.]MDY3203935.1 DNA-processing protein DprA [Arcobacter sp.]
MIKKIEFKIEELTSMKKYPNEIFYIGNTELLKRKKISIIGTRRPNSYTKEFTYKLSSKLSLNDICIVSGAAMGVDSIAHQGAKSNNTIAVVANGLDIRYPSVNKNLIIDIEKNGLMLSTYKEKEKAKNYTFILRNELVVALGDILIVTEADINSGSLSSIDFALKMKKEIYTIPHRLNESLGTQELVKRNLIKVIYDIDEFVEKITNKKLSKTDDEVLLFCKTNPTYESAISKFPNEILEYELDGKINIKNGKIFLN